MIIFQLRLTQTLKSMKRSIFYLAFLALCLSAACKSDKKEETPEISEPTTEVESEVKETTRENKEPASNRPDYFDEKRTVTVKLESNNESGVTGSIIFSQESGVVTMLAIITGLTEGEHALHIYESGDCSSDKSNASTSYHQDDIGKLVANAEGKAQITKVSDSWCIGCDDVSKNILGKTIIVNQGTTDKPIHLACGTIE